MKRMSAVSAMLLLVAAMLSGCVVVPAGGWYGHGWYGPRWHGPGGPGPHSYYGPAPYRR